MLSLPPLSRREALATSASVVAGGSLPHRLLAAEPSKPRQNAGKAKSVIMLYLHGGAPTQDMFDMKPTGPVESRGEFHPIATNVPGIDICEHLPRMAR